MDQEQLRKMIDACRPGSCDVQEPDLALLADRLTHDRETQAIYQRSQRLDAALSAAFRDVPVPQGLEQRLLAAAGALPALENENVNSPAAAATGAVRRPDRAARVSRRKFWAAAVAACVVFVLAGVGYKVLHREQEITPSELVVQMQEVLSDRDFANPVAWKAVSSPAPRAFPVAALAASPDGWRRVDTGLDRRAVVYRIPSRRGDAFVFVIGAPVKPVGIRSTPSRTPLPGATGGWRMCAWTDDGVLYILASEGDYRGLLRSRPTA